MPKEYAKLKQAERKRRDEMRRYEREQSPLRRLEKDFEAGSGVLRHGLGLNRHKAQDNDSAVSKSSIGRVATVGFMDRFAKKDQEGGRRERLKKSIKLVGVSNTVTTGDGIEHWI